MKLQALRIHGFKSFADRTSLDFRDGVTAVVGSNGCGKSNIADAIRWVLGEQRASAVRGAKMDEVIFQGTSRRRPLNFAEVSLHFSNESGRIPIPQSEVEVTRKVFREGGSEYALNRTGCRLRDIQSLLRDTGLGANAYSIIEASMIETLLSDRAEERRALFEEAAGIGRYKDSRRAATRRLEAAEGDLARLDDLVAEVESKVRSLSRQRRRAQRHRELQDLRLDLEVALAAGELAALRDELGAATARLAPLAGEEAALRSERATADALAERRRLEAAGLAPRRSLAADRHEALRQRLDAREREILLADERRAHAELRIQQLVRERAEVEARIAALDGEIGRVAEATARGDAQLDGLRERQVLRAGENEVLRAVLARERDAARETASEAQQLARELAGAEAERGAAARRGAELDDRIGRLAEREHALAEESAGYDQQTELWGGQLEALRDRAGALAELHDAAREESHLLAARERQAREALNAADDAYSRLAAQVGARTALETSYDGFLPAVAALMAERARFDGVLGPLADFLGAGVRESEAAYEAVLGPLLQAVVVADLGAARRVRDWFRADWAGGGSLLLLPLDALAGGTPAAPEAWLDALAGRVHHAGGDDLLDDAIRGVRPRVDAAGDLVDARGVVRLAERGVAGEGILQRRAALERLRAELASAAAARDTARDTRAAAAEALRDAEEQAQQTEALRRAAESEARRLEEETAAHAHRGARMTRDREEVGRALAHARDEAAELRERGSTLEARIAALRASSERLGDEAQAARERLAEQEAGWEAAREEETELRVMLARAESESRELERRDTSARRALEGSRERLATLEREAAALRKTVDGLADVRGRAGDEVAVLFAQRDEAAAELARLDTRLQETEAEAAAAAARARAAQRREAELVEERHALELRTAELRSGIERARERLEVEWGRPWDALVAAARPVAASEPAAWAEALRDAARQLEALGPVNMLAVEEHEEEERRLEFLLEQRADLVRARDDLAAAIRQINRTARDVFVATFATIRENFHRVHGSLFPGGQCDLSLADPDDPLESPVEIQASPQGKRTQRIHLLSGGERTLTALALLFALYLVKPSPFCVLDEVDAPLDEANVLRFIQLLHDFKADTQFVVITHNPRTMEAADWVYGVTMEEPGVSSIVGVELRGAWAVEDRVA